MSEQTYQHGEGCCKASCTDGEIGCGGCCLTVCCPCFALCGAAEKIDESGPLAFLMGFFGCACCAVMMLGQSVEEKRNIKRHDMGWHCIHAWCDLCSCQSCRVVNECSVYAKEGAVGAPAAVEMERK